MSEPRLLLRALPVGLAVLFVLALVPTPAAANPTVPYCAGSVNPVGNQPGVIMPEVCEQATGRVFPEASSLSTPPGQAPVSDYISYFEFQAGLEYLAASPAGQKYLTVHEVAQSVGLCPIPKGEANVPFVGGTGDMPC